MGVMTVSMLDYMSQIMSQLATAFSQLLLSVFVIHSWGMI